MSESAHNALNAMLYSTGGERKDFMLVLATNRAGDLWTTPCSTDATRACCHERARVRQSERGVDVAPAFAQVPEVVQQRTVELGVRRRSYADPPAVPR